MKPAAESPSFIKLPIEGTAAWAADVRGALGADRFRRAPLSVRILAENILRQEPDPARRGAALTALGTLSTKVDLPFRPARVVLQDLLGVPVLADLAGLRDAAAARGCDPRRIGPVTPTHLVIDHSLNVDSWAGEDALAINESNERRRNAERFAFLEWAAGAFDNLSIIGPGRGILHQINLEQLTPVVAAAPHAGGMLLYPDTLVGSDSHTTMINAMGVLGWGVGGIEAEAAMLGKPLILRLPQIVGVRLAGRPPAGGVATDIALALTERLRAAGVVGAIVEFHGPGVRELSLPDRATIANMAPEYGATAAMFAIDERTLDYMRLTGRAPAVVARAEAYARAAGLWATQLEDVERHRELDFDLALAERAIAGPQQPHQRLVLNPGKRATARTADTDAPPRRPVVIAAIASCTNTANPRAVIAAALLARNARRRGLSTPPWVRTSFTPGSLAVGRYLRAAGLQDHLDALGYQVVGHGCATCNGMSGPPLDAALPEAVGQAGITPVAVTSGNRNFAGRVHPQAREVFIMSPPLVVAHGLAGSMDRDLATDPVATDSAGRPVLLADLWPDDDEVAALEQAHVTAAAFARDASATPTSRVGSAEGPPLFAWDPDSTYIARPPYWDDGAGPVAAAGLTGLRPLVILGDEVTTDHISPSGAMAADSATARYLMARGTGPADLNSYGARRGHHEAARRATFASPRLLNRIAPGGREGPWTTIHPEGAPAAIFEAAETYALRGEGLIVIAGRGYGSGSSRDWAAKGPRLLGVRVVLAESFERIHRQNLAGMGILPLQLKTPHTLADLDLTGGERFDIGDLSGLTPGGDVAVRVRRADGATTDIMATARLDTEEDLAFFRHGGLLPQILHELTGQDPTGSPA